MHVLILDDNQERHEAFARCLIGVDRVHVYHYWECIAALRDGERFDVAYLDHDIGDLVTGDPNGYRDYDGSDVAAYIAGMPEDRRPKKVVVHSWNPSGAERIVDILMESAVQVVREPFGDVFR